MGTIKHQLLESSKPAPSLKYSADLAKRLFTTAGPTSSIIREYFTAQPETYVEELERFEHINGTTIPKARKIFIFVPAFNEERNLASLADQYANQTNGVEPLDTDLYEVCFVVNHPEHPDPIVNRSYQARFEKAIDILLEKRKTHPNIHILPKVFPANQGSLGRARKYGMDYCLWRMFKQSAKSLDEMVIISNEGDTLAIPKDYIIRFARLFEGKEPRFVQGKVEYPREIIDVCEPLRLFTGCREAVHFGQSLAVDEFPYFDGIMPIGRNFAVSPRIYAQVGGIDPVRRKDTDDDMNFGTDIHFRLGEQVKSVCDIPLITNPRREVTIVRDIVAGRNQDSKKSYEHFHENRALYDLAYDDVVAMATTQIPRIIPSRQVQCELLNQYFQWVIISRYKAGLSHAEGFDYLIKRHRGHEISYWEKEREACGAFEKHLQKIPQGERREIEHKLVTEALEWFNRFVKPLGVQYNCTREGLKSVLQ